jgi:hypothetical protein
MTRRSVLCAVVGVSSAFTCPSLLTSQARTASPAPRQVQALLFEGMRRVVLSHPWKLTFDSTSVFIRTDTSSVLTGLRYYWATYAPPGTADMLFDARAAALDSTVRAIDGPGDWFALLHTGSWAPRSQAEAVTACAEVIAYATPSSQPHRHSFVYFDQKSLNAVSSYERARLRKVGLRPPEVDHEPSGQWVVRVWAVETGRSTRYECRPAAEGSGLAAIDSVMAGMISLGP